MTLSNSYADATLLVTCSAYLIVLVISCSVTLAHNGGAPIKRDSLSSIRDPAPIRGDSLVIRRDTTVFGPDSVAYKKAAALNKTADSLQALWRIQWRKSDSLRIASMLLRMRSDSLRRSAKALITLFKDDSTVAADSAREANLMRLYSAALKNLLRKNANVLTAADSLTAAVMVTEPDSGVASFYANAFHGKKTSSGEVYNMNAKTCAHRWLPFGTHLAVRNLANGKETIVRVNDRGPFKHGRVIDLSKTAAQDLDMIRSGTARVEVRVTAPTTVPATVPATAPATVPATVGVDDLP